MTYIGAITLVDRTCPQKLFSIHCFRDRATDIDGTIIKSGHTSASRNVLHSINHEKNTFAFFKSIEMEMETQRLVML